MGYQQSFFPRVPGNKWRLRDTFSSQFPINAHCTCPSCGHPVFPGEWLVRESQTPCWSQGRQHPEPFPRAQETSTQLPQQWLWWLRVAIVLSMFLEGFEWNVVESEGGLCSSHKNLLVLLGMLRWGLGETCVVIRSPGHGFLLYCPLYHGDSVMLPTKYLCKMACNMICLCRNNSDIFQCECKLQKVSASHCHLCWRQECDKNTLSSCSNSWILLLGARFYRGFKFHVRSQM